MSRVLGSGVQASRGFENPTPSASIIENKREIVRRFIYPRLYLRLGLSAPR
jgi:hypothetical protein